MRKFIRLVAVLILIGSIGFYVWYGLMSQAGGDPTLSWVGPQMIAPILAVSLVPFIFAFTGDSVVAAFSGKNSAKFRNGLVGVGTVTGTRPTGMSINDQPEIRIDFNVQGADGQMFASYAKIVVPVTDLAMIQPGVMLPVRYLPGRTDKVEIDRTGDTRMAQAALNQAMVQQGITTQANLEIAERGIAAQAVVSSLDVTGEIRNGHPLIRLGLIVTRPNGSTFGVEVHKVLPSRSIQHVQVGRVLTVHYLPANEQELVLSVPANA